MCPNYILRYMRVLCDISISDNKSQAVFQITMGYTTYLIILATFHIMLLTILMQSQVQSYLMFFVVLLKLLSSVENM